jgi:AcrR family transcriptional regulator
MSQREASREDQLLQVATRLLMEQGYHNASIRDLAGALGVQKASLISCIESKDELFRRLMERVTS